MGDLKYPLVADLKKEISEAFGVLSPDGIALRGLFIIDKEGVVQHATINNLAFGRSVEETLRTLQVGLWWVWWCGVAWYGVVEETLVEALVEALVETLVEILCTLQVVLWWVWWCGVVTSWEVLAHWALDSREGCWVAETLVEAIGACRPTPARCPKGLAVAVILNDVLPSPPAGHPVCLGQP